MFSFLSFFAVYLFIIFFEATLSLDTLLQEHEGRVRDMEGEGRG